jgi:hypothetical protein
VLICRTPASGALAAGVKDGPLEIVKALEITGAARMANRTPIGTHSIRIRDTEERGDDQQFDKVECNAGKHLDVVFTRRGAVSNILAIVLL